jgi:hypothetical protein
MQDQGPVDQLPALRARRAQSITGSLDQTRRLLWRAFQHGELSEDEFARTLERLEPPTDDPGK